jgi:topoisomerase-4 subunit A
VTEILEECTRNTLHLLKRELEIQLHELEEKWHFSSLEKIFIENRIYRDIEEAETWEAVIAAIDEGLEPFKARFRRTITEEDIVRLTEIKIKRISKFDSFKADEYIRNLEDDIAMVKHHLDTLVDYAVEYFKNLLKKYGKGRERKTEIRTFDTIEANVVAAANVKLYANHKEGFVGTSLKKDTFITECSDIDDVIAFRKNGKYMISKVSDKGFYGKDLIHIDIWRKNDERTTYNIIYWDGEAKRAMVKRFNATGLIRDKEYDVTGGASGSEVLYFSANPNGEAERVTVFLSSIANARIKHFDYDFAQLAIKGKTAQGNLLTRYPVRRVDLKEKGVSTLGGVKIWFDEMTGRLSGEARGRFLGEFDGEDRVLIIYNDGSYELTNYELINRYEPEQVYLIQKFYPTQVIAAIYMDGKTKNYFVKRFLIETTTLSKKFPFISEEKGSQMLCATTGEKGVVKVVTENKKGEKEEWSLQLDTFMEVRGWKTLGQKLTADKVKKVTLETPRIGNPPVLHSPNVVDQFADEQGTGDEPQLNLL